MLGLADIRDWIESMRLADHYYIGKLDDKQDRSIGVYQRQAASGPRMAIGGLSRTSYDIKYISVLVHWNHSARETEEAAAELFAALRTARNVELDAEGNPRRQHGILHILRQFRGRAVRDPEPVPAVVDFLQELDHSVAVLLPTAEDCKGKIEGVFIAVLCCPVKLRGEHDPFACFRLQSFRGSRWHGGAEYKNLRVCFVNSLSHLGKVTGTVLLHRCIRCEKSKVIPDIPFFFVSFTGVVPVRSKLSVFLIQPAANIPDSNYQYGFHHAPRFLIPSPRYA